MKDFKMATTEPGVFLSVRPSVTDLTGPLPIKLALLVRQEKAGSFWIHLCLANVTYEFSALFDSLPIIIIKRRQPSSFLKFIFFSI